MIRRNFLKHLSITPFAINGFSMRPFANTRMARVLSGCDEVAERCLILIQLKGGNDGLNAIIPLDQYDLYANLRPTIRIEESALLNLDTTLPVADQVGIHPSLTAFKALYDDGRAALVQGVGYQNINQSHFKGTDIWLAGADGPTANEISSGWMGRALQSFYPDVLGTPTPDMPDPLGIQVGDPSPSLGFHTETEHQNAINLSGQDPAGFYSLVQTIGGLPLNDVPDSEYGQELDFIMSVERSVSGYAQRISTVFNAGTNSAVAYPNTSLANQLKTIARLISGGCKTKIFLCQLGGFDTHASQVANGSTQTGTHANLLTQLAEGVNAFLDDMEALGLADRAVACTFSEFGRCARENGSTGTDHGTLAPIMIFGENIKPGVNGTNVNLSDLTQDNQLRGTQFDYRQVFTTLLQDWLGASNYVLEQTMFEGFAKMPLLDSASVATPDCYLGLDSGFADNRSQANGKSGMGMTLFPNPAKIGVEITVISTSTYKGRLTLHSLGGSLVSGQQVTVNRDLNLFYLDVSNLPPGNYFVRLENSITGAAQVSKLIVAR